MHFTSKIYKCIRFFLILSLVIPCYENFFIFHLVRSNPKMCGITFLGENIRNSSTMYFFIYPYPGAWKNFETIYPLLNSKGSAFS